MLCVTHVATYSVWLLSHLCVENRSGSFVTPNQWSMFDTLYFPIVSAWLCVKSPWVSRNSCIRWVPGCDVTTEGLSLHTIAGCRTGPTWITIDQQWAFVGVDHNFLGPIGCRKFLLTQGEHVTSFLLKAFAIHNTLQKAARSGAVSWYCLSSKAPMFVPWRWIFFGKENPPEYRILRCIVSNFDLSCKGHDLGLVIWFIQHQEVHRLGSSAYLCTFSWTVYPWPAWQHDMVLDKAPGLAAFLRVIN